MPTQQPNNIETESVEPPWYRQFWPWFIIALPASAVIAGFITLYLAITRPDYVVIDDQEYQRLNSGLKAQPATPENEEDEEDANGTDSRPD